MHNLKQYFTFECRQDGVFHTLAEWKADDYRLVKEHALKNAQACAQRVVTEQHRVLDSTYTRD